MARMLTEEEVERMEKQRELQERAQKAGNPTAGMSEEERQKYVFRQAHEEAMERRRLNVLANPGAEANTNFRHSVMRDAEMRAARTHEMEMLGKELATREEEARQKRYGMAEQGMEAAKLRYGYTNYDGQYIGGGEVRLAETQAENAEKIATINAGSAEKIATINAGSAEKISREKNETAENVATTNKEGMVESERIKAQAQGAERLEERLRREREMKEEEAQKAIKMVMERARNIMQNSKRGGKTTMSEEEAIRKAKIELEGLGQLPGRKLGDYRR